MLSWLSMLLAWFRPSPARGREIFAYWDGSRKRFADPIRVLRGLISDKEFVVDRHPDLAMQGDVESTEICLAATRRVFDVQPLTELPGGKVSGLTDRETLKLLFGFGDYMEGLKKNGSGPPTLPDASVPECSDESPMKCESDSGSTLGGPKPEELPAS